MRAALYARVSDIEQVKGYSIDEQLSAMRRFCKERGWTVAAEYVEPGSSAWRGRREVFEQVLAEAERGAFDVLLTHKLDRFFRNLREMLNVIEVQFAKWGVAYVSVIENIDYSTPHGKLMLAQLASIAEYFSGNLAQVTSWGKEGRAREGLSNASVPAYGYRRIEGQDIIELNEAATVLFLYAQYATGQCSDNDLAQHLNREGIPAPQRSKLDHWTRYSVRSVLTNSFYTGMVRHDNDLYPGQHEPILEPQLFEQAQVVRAERMQRKTRTFSPSGHIYLLSGVLCCSHCGNRAWALRKKWRDGTYRYYYRCSARDQGKMCPVSVYARAEILDQQVAELIRKVELPEDWRSRLVELANHEAERDRVEAQRARLEEAQRRWQEMYAWGDITRTKYERERIKIRAELDALWVPARPAIEEAAALLESLGEVWDDAPAEVQRGIVDTLFREVYADIPGGQVLSVRLHPDFWPLFEMMEEPNGIKIKAG